MQQTLIILLMGTLGTFGYGILFYVPPRRLILATVGGFLACGAYLLAGHWLNGELIPNFIGALAGALYAEICARCTKVPVPMYMVPAMVPLAPGGALYETMFHLVGHAYSEAARWGLITVQVALGIAGGIMVASTLGLFMHPRRRKERKSCEKTGGR